MYKEFPGRFSILWCEDLNCGGPILGGVGWGVR